MEAGKAFCRSARIALLKLRRCARRPAPRADYTCVVFGGCPNGPDGGGGGPTVPLPPATLSSSCSDNSDGFTSCSIFSAFLVCSFMVFLLLRNVFLREFRGAVE